MNPKPYKLIFAGTPEFSAFTLNALIHSHHEIVSVYTQPDRPAGRGRKLTASPVKELALKHDLPINQPATLRSAEEQARLKDLNADLMIVVAYGLILPLPVLTAPKLGCINVHASLLPRWRGAAPIQRAILAGDEQTGITIMQMDEGLDTGAMLHKEVCTIERKDTAEILHNRLAPLGAKALLYTLDHLAKIQPLQQNNLMATYAHKLKKEEAKLNWDSAAEELDRMIRAFNPWPVAFFDQIRVWEAEMSKTTSHAPPGTIIYSSPAGIEVATGHGVLRLLKLQLPNARTLPVKDILNAHSERFAPGQQL